MPLAPSTRLGPYEILAPLGAGGMGEVYRALDPRMGREVAIKVSAERFSDRFEREVRAVAALNHPNICHLYDVGPNYLVMELVEGPTLADRIKQGAIPLEEALTIARQIGDALEAAHEKGIVHRDLKPANIKIKPDGVVKVLDFGLAKMTEQVAPAGNPESSPTVPMEATIAGQIMGTAAYMAPEQARGKTVDKRADIWAFGVVLYEMLSGRRLFEGETISDTLAGVLTKEPDWERVPAKARRLLQRCLEKDPKRRLRDIGDAWLLLEDKPEAPTAKSGALWKVAAGVAVVVSAISLWAPWRAALRPAGQPAVQLDLDLGSDMSLGSSTGPAAILSPDGDRIVFVSQSPEGTRRLYTRRLDQPASMALANTGDAYAPFFSPDGQWVGFFAGGKLKKTRLDGGETVVLCDAPAGRGASWSEDNMIVAALDVRNGLSQIPADGGKPASLTELNAEELSHRWPQVLPGGKAVLFMTNLTPANYAESAIVVASLVDHRRKTVLERGGMYPRYLPSGHLVYLAKGKLFAVPFDADRLEVHGPATPVLEEVANDPAFGSAQFDFSRGGTMLYRRGKAIGQRIVQWLDGAGNTQTLLAEPAFYQMPRLSPDGTRLALVVSKGSSSDVWVYDIQQGSKARLTASAGVNADPVWTPDGRFLVFQSAGGTFWARADGAGKPQPFTVSKTPQYPASFTADGTRLALYDSNPGRGAVIRTVPVSGPGQPQAGKPELFLQTLSDIPHPAFSPDGHWLAYASVDSGTYEVYVRAFPDKGTQRQISNNGGNMPIWSRNGRELFYRTDEQRIMVVNYTVKGDSFMADKPRMWCARQLANTGLTPNLDLSPDGKRFVVVMPAEGPEPRETQSHVTVVVNFLDEVRRRLAGQGK